MAAPPEWGSSMIAAPVDVNVRHGVTLHGRYTELSYKDATGHPMMTRFAGVFNKMDAVALLMLLRKNDRNRIGAAR